jgi:diguanylate cyclase (GGDEF)-like protein
MTAQGEIVGILHVRNGFSRGAGSTPGAQAERLRLARLAAESIGLALANLKLREMLREQSIRDALTGLFNRRYMEESLSREILRAARAEQPVGVAMLDIDGFKPFNDRFGHSAGDTLLRELGSVLLAAVRGEDIPCRYGGEELVLIMPDASREDTRLRAEQVREQVKRLRLPIEGFRAVSVSIGVASFPEHGPTPDDLLKAADEALYRAKAQGRDRVVVATPRPVGSVADFAAVAARMQRRPR